MGRFPSISMSLPPSPCLPSCCRHVCFLMPTGFSLVRAVSPFMPSVSFFANLSFSYAAPSSSYVPRCRWDGGRGTLLQDPTFFGAILYAELVFFYAAFVLFLCSMGCFPSISMSLPPSPCLPSWGRGTLVQDPTFFGAILYAELFFLCCVCPFLMLHGALSIHLHVSPSISMSQSCCRHVCFRTANPTFFCCSCPSCAP